MLSTENPPADPPPPPSQYSRLQISSSGSDDKLPLVSAEVDLFKSGLHESNDNPLSNFSIRNYVSSARRKDITGNWPFSERNLLLCLQHGLTDPLPPFDQLLDSLNKREDQSNCNNCATVEDNDTSLLRKEIINISHPNGELPASPTHHQFPSLTLHSAEPKKKKKKQLPLDSLRTKSNDSTKGDSSSSSSPKKLHPKEAACIGKSCPHLVSLPTNISDSTAGSALGAPTTLCEANSAKNPDESHVTETPGKKCRLLVKLTGLGDHPNKKEDIIKPNNTTFMGCSETMASKVCPVCKTFSSSSNTTLNAHIDQCLSGESTIKWTANPNSKVVNHLRRIKPRKTKLMVDIYSMAPYCTLEELDRRNGRSWDTNSNSPLVNETWFRTGEKVQRLPPVNTNDVGNKDTVYINTDGTKVRILSKFNEVASVSSVGDDPGPQKTLKRDKGSKFLSIKKRKKLHIEKHHKLPKLSPHRKTFSSPKPCQSMETRGGQERNFAMEENWENEKERIQCFKGKDKARLDDIGTIRRSTCSQEIGVSKKMACKVDFLAKNGQSSFRHASMSKRFVNKKTPNSGSPISSPQNCKRMETSSYKQHVAEYREKPALRERIGLSSLGSRVGVCGKNSPVLPAQNLKQLKKRGTSEDEYRFMGSPKKLASSQISRAVQMNAGPTENSTAFVISSKPSRHPFSPLRKNTLSVNKATVPESKSHLKRKFPDLKKSRVNCISKFDDDARVVWPYRPDEQHNMAQDHSGEQSRTEEITDKGSLSRHRVLKIGKKRRPIKIRAKEEGISLKSSPQCHGNCVGETSRAMAPTFDKGEYVRKEVQSHSDHVVIELTSRMAVKGSSLSKSLDPKFHKIATRPCDTQRDLELSGEVYEVSLFGAQVPTGPSLGDKEEAIVFCGYEADKDINGEHANMVVVQLDSRDGQLGNLFSKVDVIPIPGPPGSFLPSPEDMGSEDHQGYSSLTTMSRADHSFEDGHGHGHGHGMVYRDSSSDSPVSEISTISNPTLARSDSRSSEKLSVGPHAVHDENLPCFSVASIDPSVDTRRSFDRLIHVDDSSKHIKRGPLSLKNEQQQQQPQPCCCSRKEGASQQGGLSLNYQEHSQQFFWSNDPHNLNSRSEMFSLKKYPSSGPEKTVLAGNVPTKVSTEAEVNFPIRVDCDSVGPYASNPVLRLMGKDLMVVKKDDDDDNYDMSLQYRQFVSSTTKTGQQNYDQFFAGSGFSPGNDENEEKHLFPQVVPQSPVIYGQKNQHFDARFL